MSAHIIQFPDPIRIPAIPPGAVYVTDKRPLLGDMLAAQRVANMLRRASEEMQTDGQTTAAHWLAEAVGALAVGDMADLNRCLDMAARAWMGTL